MYGLTVRWSLHATTTDVAQRLRDYVRAQSYPRVSGMPGLHQTIWTLREGGSFGATYVWETEEARARFVARMRAEGTPVSRLIGHSADAFEEFEVVAIAEGGSGMIVLPGQAGEPSAETIS